MTRPYTSFAGQSLERLGALSDGVFAIAMTLLVLELHVPAASVLRSEAELQRELLHLAPQILLFFISVLTLGIFWVGQLTQLNHLTRSSRAVTWIHLAFLAFVTLVPFTTRLLGEHVTLRTALAIYWANIFLMGFALWLSWRQAGREGLVSDTMSPLMRRAVAARIFWAQSLYALSAALSVFGVGWALAALLALQLHYAFGPNLGGVWRRMTRSPTAPAP